MSSASSLQVIPWRKALLMSADKMSQPRAAASLTTTFWELLELVPAYRSTSNLPLSLKPRTVSRARMVRIQAPFCCTHLNLLDHPAGIDYVARVAPQLAAEAFELLPSLKLFEACGLNFFPIFLQLLRSEQIVTPLDDLSPCTCLR